MQSTATMPTSEAVPTPASPDKRYFDLMAYITSNTVAGEIMAVENYSEMVPLMPSTDAKIDTVKQAFEEAKHIRMLSSLGKRLDYEVKDRIVEPQWLAIRKHFSAAVAKRDLAACLIIQDIMTETMAIVLYRMLQRDTDPVTRETAAAILKDEELHLQMGIDRLAGMLEADREAVHDALIWAHHRVMPELFSMVSTSCHSLCDELQVDCGGIGLDSIRTDIEALRVEALDTYMESLDRVGFDVRVTTPLIASMSSYGAVPSADLRLRATDDGAACGATDAARCC
ncbi:ferritin-like fold-containing protein [Denitromonas iodatirespirans]|uniref:Long-chain fatty aldehyde decarbonylase n=1 Tax=Denitromonas iodatirespirans TaxID=2795389 RepID=A0A944DBK3_DENI1|nr:ferritin-like fold-containing protein [Denitromonas iodatirespirans]MBT0962397.1 long-chain fatty aldehyde decarbonylase [Denitromonas iodatirespirans]